MRNSIAKSPKIKIAQGISARLLPLGRLPLREPAGLNLAIVIFLSSRVIQAHGGATLPLLAVALAVPPKRSSSSLGIFLGIVIVVAYHKVNQYAEQAGAQGRIEPIVALWVPLLVLAGLIVWMYHVLAHKPGGQPIGALERGAAKSWRAVRSLFPKARTA